MAGSQQKTKLSAKLAKVTGKSPLSGLVSDDDVAPPPEVVTGEVVEQSFNDSLQHRVVMSLIKSQIKLEEAGDKADISGHVSAALDAAGCSPEQYVQMISDPEFLAYKERMERAFFVDTFKGPMLQTLARKAMGGDMTAMRLVQKLDENEDETVRRMAAKLNSEGDEALRRAALEAQQRLNAAMELSEAASANEKAMEEAERLATTREDPEDILSELNDADIDWDADG